MITKVANKNTKFISDILVTAKAIVIKTVRMNEPIISLDQLISFSCIIRKKRYRCTIPIRISETISKMTILVPL